MAKEFISKENLAKFASLVKGEINSQASAANSKISAVEGRATSLETLTKQHSTAISTNSSDIATLKSGKLNVTDFKVKTLNGQPLKGDGNISLADIGIDGEIVKIVTELPKASDALSNKLYLMKVSGAPEGDTFAEYVKVTVDGADKWEKIGEWKADITIDTELSTSSTNPVQNKVVKAEVDKKVDKVSGKGLSTNDYTTDEKNKLAGIEEGANKYTLPLSASDTRGGIQIGFAQTGRKYPVALENEKAYVNVPWTDTKVAQIVLPHTYSKAITLLGTVEAAGSTAGVVYLGNQMNGVTYTPNIDMLTVGGEATGIVKATKFMGDLSGIANKATSDADGNNISTTYLKTANFDAAFNAEFTELSETDIENLWTAAK